MDFLKAEIERKRKLNDVIRNSTSQETNVIGSSKFIRHGDRKRIEEEQLQEEQRKLDLKREKNSATTVEFETEKRIAPQLVSFSSAEKKQISYSSLFKLTISEVKDRLRQFGQPVTYFGETNEKRVERLIAAVKQNESKEVVDDNFAFKHKIVANDEEEDALDAEDLKEEQEESAALGRKDGTDVEHSEGEGGDSDGEDGTNRGNKSVLWDPHYHFSKIPGLAPEKVIYKFFRALIKQWEFDLGTREDREKSTAKGKLETRTHKQCKDCIRPLFRLCKKKEVPYDILVKLELIVKCCEEGNFRAANDQYIATAIGNAAWPIGLTMVGIHERSGREKISTSKVAHMMNNELQRKYFTSVKRLMTYAQNKRPDVPPSMKVA